MNIFSQSVMRAYPSATLLHRPHWNASIVITLIIVNCRNNLCLINTPFCNENYFRLFFSLCLFPFTELYRKHWRQHESGHECSAMPSCCPLCTSEPPVLAYPHIDAVWRQRLSYIRRAIDVRHVLVYVALMMLLLVFLLIQQLNSLKGRFRWLLGKWSIYCDTIAEHYSKKIIYIYVCYCDSLCFDLY